MTPRITEIFSDSRTCKRGIILEGRRICCRSCNDDGIIHCSLLFQGIHYGSYRRAFLADGHINAIDRIPGEICLALIENGVDRYRSLAGLTVADYEFALTTADRNHRINGFEACLKRFGNRLTKDDSWSLPFKWHLTKISPDRTLSVKRFSQRIDNSPKHRFAYIYGSDPSRTLCRHTLLDLIRRAKQNGSYVILFKVHNHCHHAIVELKKFSSFGIQQSVYPDHSVTHLKHLPHLFELEFGTYVLELAEQNFRNLRRPDCICHN